MMRIKEEYKVIYLYILLNKFTEKNQEFYESLTRA